MIEFDRLVVNPSRDATNGQVKATQFSLNVLDEIHCRNGAGATELATHFDHSESTVHSHLRTLIGKGYLINDDEYYTIGLRSLQLGGHVRMRRSHYQMVKDEVDEFAEETGETAKLVIEKAGKGVYLYQTHSKQVVTTDFHVGSLVFLHSTAVRKAILADLDEQRRDKILDKYGLPEVTPNTVTDTGTRYSPRAHSRAWCRVR